jgi:hypothetical protein
MDWQPTPSAIKDRQQKRGKWVPEQRIRNKRCIRCGAPGHFIDRCPYLPANNSQPFYVVVTKIYEPELDDMVVEEVRFSVSCTGYLAFGGGWWWNAFCFITFFLASWNSSEFLMISFRAFFWRRVPFLPNLFRLRRISFRSSSTFIFLLPSYFSIASFSKAGSDSDHWWKA